MKKKIVAGMICAMMLMATVTVQAEDPKMTVSYSQDSSYILSIPQNIDLKVSESVISAPIGLSEVNIKSGEQVQVKIKSGIANGKVELSGVGDRKVISEVAGSFVKGQVNNGSVVAEFQDMDSSTKETLTFSEIKDPLGGKVRAGAYVGTLIFETKSIMDGNQ